MTISKATNDRKCHWKPYRSGNETILVIRGLNRFHSVLHSLCFRFRMPANYVCLYYFPEGNLLWLSFDARSLSSRYKFIMWYLKSYSKQSVTIIRSIFCKSSIHSSWCIVSSLYAIFNWWYSQFIQREQQEQNRRIIGTIFVVVASNICFFFFRLFSQQKTLFTFNDFIRFATAHALWLLANTKRRAEEQTTGKLGESEIRQFQWGKWAWGSHNILVHESWVRPCENLKELKIPIRI